MSTHHAAPAEVVDLATWAGDLPFEKSKAIVKTAAMELARLVLPAGQGLPDHRVDGPIVIHCISGRLAVTTSRGERELGAGQLLHLPPGDPHAVVGIEDAVVLLTIVFLPA